MGLQTIGSLVGAANAAKDLQAMAANFFLNFRKYANGVGATIPRDPFVVVPVGVKGTPEAPRIEFALVWTERTTWQVTEYLSPDHDSFNESWGADNSCGSRIESREYQRESRVTVAAAQLLLPNEKQIELMRRWKSDADAAEKERDRLAQIDDLKKRINQLEGRAATDPRA
jgi:hypothetical protein